MRILRFVMAALMIVYWIFAPGVIQRGLARNPYADWLTPEKPAWEGRIELWHIASFKVWQGSVTHYLEERAVAYGRSHPGVHIDVVGMTEAQYESRIARGAFPDAYSFPAGLVYAEQLRSADYADAPFLGNLAPAETENGRCALPWFMSGYFIAANMQLLAKQRVELPESIDAAFLQSALEQGGLAMPQLLAARAGLGGAPADIEEFRQGRAMLAVLDARALGELMRSGGLPLDSRPYAPWTELVQYIGADARTDETRAAVVASFAAFLLSDEEQNRLSTLGALPVTASAQPAYAASEMTALWEAYREPVSPEPFLFERHKGALMDEAALALGGDTAAKKSFSERMAVVERGKL